MTSPQYATAKPFFEKAGPAVPNLAGSPEDLERIRAYRLYEDFYYNRPETFKVFLRGEDSEPVYIPSAKKMVEAMNRFLCKKFAFVVPPKGNQAGEGELIMRMENLFKREKMYAKFKNQKRQSLIRGDGMFYVTADPNKDQFSRISIHELNPANYFPIVDPNDKTRVIGCHIVEVVQDPREKDDRTKMVARRQTYLKAGVSYNSSASRYEVAPGSQHGVFTETTHWEIGKWDDRNLKADDLEKVPAGADDLAMMQLPQPITSLPVYHWRNVVVDGSLFGNSEISGIETLIAGVNQDLSDAQLTLVLQGLGVYATDSKPPVDEAGESVGWDLGPGQVVEMKQGAKFERISGVSSMSPAMELIGELKNGIQEANGIPDIAAGKVDVTVAESGISLALQLAPILAAGEEKESEILGTIDHMLYDLKNQWFPAYEGVSFGEDVSIVSTVDEAMPVNREQRIQEVMLLFTSNLITIAAAQAELAKLGYKFMSGDEKQVLIDAAALAAAQSGDANRYAQEVEPPTRELTEGAGELPEGFVGGNEFGGGAEQGMV